MSAGSSIATLDWVIVAVLLASVLLGVWRGLVFELLSLAAWALAFVCAQLFAGDVAKLLPMTGSSESLRFAAGFGMVFVLTLFAGGLVAVLVKKLIAATGLAPFDRVMGAAFGLLRGLLLLLAATVVLGLTPAKSSNWWKESVGAGLLAQTLKGLKPVLPEEFGRHLT